MREAEEKTFTTHDGVELFYRHWPAAGAPRGAVVLFHRGHEHSGRMAHLVDELDLRDFAFFAWDARGHGRSPGERGYSPSFGTSVRDVQCFVDHIAATYGIPAVTIFGPTNEKWSGPLNPRAKVVRADIHCRPCYEFMGYRVTCEHCSCLEKIKSQDVIAAVEEVVRRGPSD